MNSCFDNLIRKTRSGISVKLENRYSIFSVCLANNNMFQTNEIYPGGMCFVFAHADNQGTTLSLLDDILY